MTKSQNTKNEQHCIKQNEKSFIQKDLSLTELWQKGELPSGWYYVRLIRGEYRIDLYINGKNEWIDCPDNIIDTVVCEVPSYDEYQKLLSEQLAKIEGEEINAELEHRLAMVKANGKYPDRISRLKSRVVALSEENSKLKSKLQLKETAYDFDTARLEEENTKLKKQLAIAVEALEFFSDCSDWNDIYTEYVDKKEVEDVAIDYLKQIEELNK